MNTQTTDNSPELATGLLAAQRAVQSVRKGSTNQYHKYDYTSAEDMIAAAREALHAGGLAVSVTGFAFAPLGDSEVMICTTTYRLEHYSGAAREYVFSLTAQAEKGRPLDKALLGAQTTSLNYFLRNLLLIPREDKNEIDQRDDRNHEPTAVRPSGPMGESDAAGLAALLADRGVTEGDLRAHLTALRVVGGNVSAPMHLWPKAWKPDIRDFLGQHPVKPKAPEPAKPAAVAAQVNGKSRKGGQVGTAADLLTAAPIGGEP